MKLFLPFYVMLSIELNKTGWNPKGYGNKMENESTNHLIYMYDLKLRNKDDGNLKGLL